eukprot:SAG31_NODE_418_length_15893_cov_5.433899_14_plen_66_part_00
MDFCQVLAAQLNKTIEIMLHKVTVSVPTKPKLLATMKSMNYMLNQLAKLEVDGAGAVRNRHSTWH